jgi:hypothetical protein
MRNPPDPDRSGACRLNRRHTACESREVAPFSAEKLARDSRRGLLADLRSCRPQSPRCPQHSPAPGPQEASAVDGSGRILQLGPPWPPEKWPHTSVDAHVADSVHMAAHASTHMSNCERLGCSDTCTCGWGGLRRRWARPVVGARTPVASRAHPQACIHVDMVVTRLASLPSASTCPYLFDSCRRCIVSPALHAPSLIATHKAMHGVDRIYYISQRSSSSPRV